jgi:urea transport system substrate-binding protein
MAKTQHIPDEVGKGGSPHRTEIRNSHCDDTFPIVGGQPRISSFEFLAPPQCPEEMGRLGSYRILGLIGQGGMGVVFRAEEALTERQVALKVIQPQSSRCAEFRERFLREGRLAASLEHERIVPIFRVEEINGVPALVMPLLKGESLETRLQRPPRLPVREVVRLGLEMSEGLEAAHDAGIVHRDIKPANVWLRKTTPDQPAESGHALLLDFGLARSGNVSGWLTEIGSVVGTACYMSPEQAAGEPIDVRSDLFSLGCVLYEMCTGQQAFGGSNLLTIMRNLALNNPSFASDVVREVPHALADLIRQMLRKDRSARPASARAVIAALTSLGQTLANTDEPKRIELAEAGETNVEPGAAPKTARPESTWSATAPPRAGPPSPLSRALGMIVSTVALAGVALVAFFLGGRDQNHGVSTRNEASNMSVAPNGAPVLVGVLHSLSGTMANSESAVVDATLFAIEEINRSGGVLDRPIKAIVADGKSDPATFAREAERLLTKDKVVTVFGCWTSASRKTVKPVFEEHDSLLVYPVQYEGLEISPNILYTGAAPNQQIIPAIEWAVGTLKKKRFFLIGSDYVFPRTANEVLKDRLGQLGAEVVGEHYLPLGDLDIQPAIDAIVQAKPDMILNTINGDSNTAFFRGLRRAGIMPAQIPTMSFSIGEQELRSLPLSDTEGDYAAWTYFETVATPENDAFLARFGERRPQHRVTDPMEAAYVGVNLWARSVADCQSVEVKKIRRALLNQRLSAPEGEVRVDADTQHCFKTPRIGRIRGDGRFEIVWTAAEPCAPQPFPNTRTTLEWRGFLHDLYTGWGDQWSAPATKPSRHE